MRCAGGGGLGPVLGPGRMLGVATERAKGASDRAARLASSRPAGLPLSQRDFHFLGTPGGVGQRLADIVSLQARILAKNFLARAACGDEADDSPDRDAHASDRGFPAHYAGITSDASELWHRRDSADIVRDFEPDVRTLWAFPRRHSRHARSPARIGARRLSLHRSRFRYRWPFYAVAADALSGPARRRRRVQANAARGERWV